IEQDKLRELAVALTATIKNNTSIDWTIKASVRAKLKVAVKRLVRKYGYPPDMQLLATETVLKQAALLAKEMTSTGLRSLESIGRLFESRYTVFVVTNIYKNCYNIVNNIFSYWKDQRREKER